MNPLLAASDGFDIIFVVLFLVVGFIQWLIKLFQQKAEDAKRAKTAPRTQADVEAARRARLEELQTQRRARQTGDDSELPPALPKPTAPTFGGPPSPMAELLESLRKAAEAANKPAAAPEAPPPLPQSPPPLAPPVRSVRVNVPVAVQEEPPQASGHRKTSHVMTLEHHLERQQGVTTQADAAYNDKSRKRNHSLTDFLRTSHGYQQAFVLREVLGPPKALQRSDDWVY
jgi:hypothetical protein